MIQLRNLRFEATKVAVQNWEGILKIQLPLPCRKVDKLPASKLSVESSQTANDVLVC